MGVKLGKLVAVGSYAGGFATLCMTPKDLAALKWLRRVPFSRSA